MDHKIHDIEYSAPTVVELGALSEQTLVDICKTGVAGDVIHINNSPPIPIPGSTVVSCP